MQRPPSRKATIPEPQDASRQMRRASEKMRASLEGNRSDKLLRLFEFLLERTLAGDPPTEQQIAEGVFSTGQTDGPRPDANVRVYVHRLRKLIGATFADTPGPRLDLPPGAYKLRLINLPPGEDVEPEELSNPIGRRRIWRAGRWGAAILLGAGFALLAVISLMVPLYDAGPRLNSAMPWAAISDSDRPITIVMGDYFLYAEFGGQRDRRSTPKLIWDQGVPTREDLIIYQILNPANADAVADLDQQYVTSATLTAATAIRSALRRDAVFQRRRVRLIAASQLTAEMLKLTDIVYVGQLSGLGAILRDPLFQASGLSLDAGRGALSDTTSGKIYRSDGMELRDEQIPRRDYGYLARLPGPSGNNVLIVASIRDAGLKEMSELATDPVRLDTLPVAVTGSARGFEVLFQVRTMGSVNLGATPVIRRIVHSQGIWDRSAATPAYRPISGATPAAGQ